MDRTNLAFDALRGLHDLALEHAAFLLHVVYVNDLFGHFVREIRELVPCLPQLALHGRLYKQKEHVRSTPLFSYTLHGTRATPGTLVTGRTRCR